MDAKGKVEMTHRLTDKEQIFAELFHTALRKSLDSKASSICWNAIHILEGDAWGDFVHNVVSGKGKKLTKKVCVDAIEYGRADRNLLRIGLEMLTDEEYGILDKWIRDCS